MSQLSPLEQLDVLMEEAWHQQLCLFLGELADDLLAGRINVEECNARLAAIQERGNDK